MTEWTERPATAATTAVAKKVTNFILRRRKLVGNEREREGGREREREREAEEEEE